jgi:hypothetical protein
VTAATTELTPREQLLAKIAEAREERDRALQHVNDADERRGGWDRKVIDQSIKAFAETGGRFSANDLRDLLPEVHQPLIGARFRVAAVAGLISRVGYEASSSKSTHGHPIAVWVRAQYVEAGESA